jgi:transcriptional regulator with XRE-family HTH domain
MGSSSSDSLIERPPRRRQRREGTPAFCIKLLTTLAPSWRQGYWGKYTLEGEKVRRRLSRYGRGTGVPNPIDVHVGKSIRMGRLFLDMNQLTLANVLGQKYEHGANRVSASRVSATADILGVPISFFFDGFAPGTPEETALRERLERPETIELVRRYYAIPDQCVRQQFLEMVKVVAARNPSSAERVPEAPCATVAAGGRVGNLAGNISRGLLLAD